MKLSSLTLSGLFASCFLFCEEAFSLVIEASTNEENSSESNLDEESHRHLLEEIVSDGTFKNNVKRDDTSVVQKSRHLQTTMLKKWAQQGNTVSGEGFGKSVALSRNGKALVVGAPDANSDDGKIKIYIFVNSQWNLVQTIEIDGYGGITKEWTVSMNPEGTHIAVHNLGSFTDGGSFSVYEYNIGTAPYLPLGSTIQLGSNPNGYYYSGIEISRNGKRVAVGKPNGVGIQGRAYVYEYNSVLNDWQIIFDTDSSSLGTDVSLAENGKSIAVVTNAWSHSACSVDVWKEDSSSNWVKSSLPLVPNSICSGASLESVSISADGMRIALANPLLNTIGGTYVFDKVGPNWVLDSNTPLMGKGSAVAGRHPANGDYCGSVVISADGSKLIMACPGAGVNDDGYAIVYEVDESGTWSQAGPIILTTPPESGSRVASVDIAVDQDGRTRVAVGSDTATTLIPIGSAAVHELMFIPGIDPNAEKDQPTVMEFLIGVPLLIIFLVGIAKGSASLSKQSW
eukprot:CAMPEP_0194081148 /NCGR_PEP_ID=MMETSP0149-20130528/7018_1 /TAXON_ID=122233 /ORGANISM="Chaetoceros debilis, Strain MM31A-1" /LENGTH=511 /DNA_ID=CAMNT_0038763019 /DNA_START=94 /DNA_END=1626 /DNA_ORIENTATION=-